MQHIYEVPNLSGNAFPAIVNKSCGGRGQDFEYILNEGGSGQ